MKAWDIYTFNFPEAGPHPAVIISSPERTERKPFVSVLLGSSQRAARAPAPDRAAHDRVQRVEPAVGAARQPGLEDGTPLAFEAGDVLMTSGTNNQGDGSHSAVLAVEVAQQAAA